jgi:hypothetical protein
MTLSELNIETGIVFFLYNDTSELTE